MAGESSPIDPRLAAELKRLQERAKSAREMRRSAPEVDVNGFVTIPQKDIINRVAKDSGGQDGEWHFTFQDRKDSERLVDRGYEPATEHGKWVDFEGDPLWKIPTGDFERSLRENKARSDAMLSAKWKADAKATGEKATAQTVNL